MRNNPIYGYRPPVSEPMDGVYEPVYEEEEEEEVEIEEVEEEEEKEEVEEIQEDEQKRTTNRKIRRGQLRSKR
ncbi:hypothetical protein M8J76_014075 [Diaphorina citri]|nr:hypothetical protein M8J75_009529 [Diaphorina citri]KAI5722810.1 hypothetical protein M8J76_014075 [Diaphorina citri]